MNYHYVVFPTILLLSCTITSGIIYGWSSYEILLVDIGVYKSLNDPILTIIPIVVFNVASLSVVISGFTIDHFGIKINATLGTLLFSLGLLALSHEIILIGLCLIAYGGMQCVLCLYPFSNLFSNETTGILLRSFINCCYNLSGLTFLILGELTNFLPISTLLTIYLCFTICAAFGIVSLFPWTTYMPVHKHPSGEHLEPFTHVHIPVYSWSTVRLGIYFGFMLLISNIFFTQVPAGQAIIFNYIIALVPLPVTLLLPYHFNQLKDKQCFRISFITMIIAYVCLIINHPIASIVSYIIYTYCKCIFINLVYHLIFQQYSHLCYGRAISLVTAITIPFGLVQLLLVMVWNPPSLIINIGVLICLAIAWLIKETSLVDIVQVE